MEAITVGFLKEILANVPDDYTIYYKNGTVNADFEVNKIEIDITGKKLIVK